MNIMKVIGKQLRHAHATSRFAQVLALILCLGLSLGNPVMAQELLEESDPMSDAALGVASALLTIPYAAAKILYAALGGVIGGFTWVLTGGDTDTAQTVWQPSFYGTYVITPDHLRGKEPVRFIGQSPYDESYN